MSSDNKLLGQFDLSGIPPAPRGVPQIEVTFDIDANGIVHVSSKDKASGKTQSITVQSSGGLSEADIQKMIRQADEMKEKDRKIRVFLYLFKEVVDAKNEADTTIHTTEKSLSEYKDKLPQNEIEEIQSELDKLREIVGD